MKPPSAYLFDIGNVILGFDFSIAVAKLREFGISHKDPFAHIGELKDRYEAGALGDSEFVELAIGELGFAGGAPDFIPIWQQIFHENRAMAGSIRELAAHGHPLYLLSNTNGLHLEHILERYPIFGAFAGGIYSHEAKSMKPGLPMYEQAIERFGLQPGETLYIDDLLANIETGKSLGFRTHHYDINKHQAFADELPASLR